MKPKLVHDWRQVVARSFSMWMQIAGLAALFLPEIRFWLTGADSNPVFLFWLAALLLLAGTALRLVRQESAGSMEWLKLVAVAGGAVFLAFLLSQSGPVMPRDGPEPVTEIETGKAPLPLPLPEIETAEAEALKIAVPFIARWEGKRNEAYQDIVGVWTICYGHTRNARAGMVKSDQECTELLRDEVAEYRSGLHGYFSEETQKKRLTPERDAAYTSLAFNVGIRGAGRSTAIRRLNAGDIAGGCQALTWWNKAGGRVIRGLVNRRKEEHALCMVGV